ncbi:NAD(P)/FAD-dependent oxidoreductase [Longimycelium tulufanense]|uniref:NAD(P)/FAD-dependent oxidoreductase n=1 Tax=Longimycelium tulufanense TaxID=907463 RepID=UPI001E3E1736|nr:FAD-dependent monooxygenase [Longimycelium tulufanense]
MRPRRAVVLGGGLSGMLVASAVSGAAFDEVLLVERDRFPVGPEPRKGVPQARHAHNLVSGGARALESLLPGVLDRLQAEGAQRFVVPRDVILLGTGGWVRRYDGTHFFVSCSRDLLDWVVRNHVLASGTVQVLEGTVVAGLSGSARRVTGVTVRDVDTGEARELVADLVIDATGRGSQTSRWLQELLGLPRVREDVVRSGLRYATCLFSAPVGSGFPLISIQSHPREQRCGRAGGVLMPIEGGRWLVTVWGSATEQPPQTLEEFVPFAQRLRDPVLADVLAGRTALTPVRRSDSTVNRRRRYEELPVWPEGLLVAGDALAAFNPVYGHGMSVAAQSALALRRQLSAGTREVGTTRTLQRMLCRVADGAWAMATGEDVLYPGVAGDRRTTALARLRRRGVERMSVVATSRPTVAEALFGAFTLEGAFSQLLSPRLLWDVLRGPAAPPLQGPPLTTRERQLAGLDR